MKSANNDGRKMTKKKASKNAPTMPASEVSPTRKSKQMRLGILEKPGFMLPEEFFEPIPDDELKLWNGEEN